VSVVFLAEHTVHVKMNSLTDYVVCWSVISVAFFSWLSQLAVSSVHEK